ncbi:synaptotagmin-6-like [Diadema antillarum]
MFQSRDGSPTGSRPSSGKPSPTKPLPRQSTVPLLPQKLRQEAFRKQRQLSLQLNLANVEFSVKNINATRKDQTDLIGTLRPELYRQESKDKGKTNGEKPSCGRLVFSLFYDYATETLNVHIDRAVNLPAKDFSGTSDPYVKIYLCPDRKRKYQTKVHRKNCDPVFDERFAFQIPYNELETKTLKFTVYDFDRFSRHDLIGEVNVTSLLTDRDLSKETQYVEDIVKGSSQEKADLGEVMFSLNYLPTACRLTLTVIKARNLKAMDITGASDPYVKVSLMSQGKRMKKKKTTVKKNTLNPVYNEAMVFDVAPDSMQNICLVVAVVDYDWVGHSELIGVCEVGPNAPAQGSTHWADMLANPRKPIAQWYQLQESTPALSVASLSAGLKNCMGSSQQSGD